LFETKLTTRQSRSEGDSLVLESGIGLTDISKHLFASDEDLKQSAFNVGGFIEKILKF
jgi:hypothetical protein